MAGTPAGTPRISASVQWPHGSHMIDMNAKCNVKDVVGTLDIMPQQVIPTYSALMTAVQRQHQQYAYDLMSRDAFMDGYHTHTLRYHCQPEQMTFAQAYHALVHCPIGIIFDTLLKLEEAYASTIHDLLEYWDREKTKLSERYASDTSQARFREEEDFLQATCASELEQMQQAQREEYHAFVIELYHTYQQTLQAMSDPAEAADEAKRVMAAIAQRLADPSLTREPGHRRRHHSTTSLSSVLSDQALTSDHALQRMQEMGIDAQAAEEALRLTNNDVERAIALVFESPPSDQRQSTESTKQARSRSTSMSTSARSVTSGRSSAWPMSFIPVEAHGSMRKIGGWIGKAVENLAPSSVSASAPRLGAADQDLVESFTISLGSPLKSTHNLRLLVCDTGDVLDPPHDATREMAYRAQTATKLYTHHLDAVVVLVPDTLEKYRAGLSNSALFRRCRRATEFHFSSLDHQLAELDDDRYLHSDGGDHDNPLSVASPGSVLVTRHSNLPLAQVVFHLVVDPNHLDPLDQHHPLLRGLRTILHVATRYDITSLTIPLLMLPDTHAPVLSLDAWQHRGEAVLKCVKGFLIEHSRSRKHAPLDHERSDAVLGAELRTVEFVLPPNLVAAPSSTSVQSASSHPPRHPPSHHSGITEDAETIFQHFRTVFKDLFQTH